MTFKAPATCMTGAVLMCFAIAHGAMAQDAPVRVPRRINELAPDIREKLQAGLDKLKLEAEQLDDLNEPKPAPRFTRPHPAVARWGQDMVIPALVAMTEDLTGQKQRDIYIHWHLMWVVSGKSADDDRQAITQVIERVFREVPGDIVVPYQTEWTAEPRPLYDEWYRIYHNELRIVVGYPPFQKYINPPESLEYMEPGRRAIAEKFWQRAQALQKRFTIVRIDKAYKFNDRVAELNYLIRLYRGELVYELVRSGDPKMLNLIMDAIDRQARARTNGAFDMLNYLYIAANDGHLRQYDIDDLQAFARRLEAAAKATEKFWVPQVHTQRNFAQYAYHMIETLKAGEKFDFGQ
jgi:hypothetical protein